MFKAVYLLPKVLATIIVDETVPFITRRTFEGMREVARVDQAWRARDHRHMAGPACFHSRCGS